MFFCGDYRKRNLSLFRKTSRTRKNIQEGIQNILPLQQTDGGFALWKTADHSLLLSFGVCSFGLEQTRLAGFSIDDRTLDSLREYVWNVLKTPPSQNNPDTLPPLGYHGICSVCAFRRIPFDLSLFSVLRETPISSRQKERACCCWHCSILILQKRLRSN